MTDLGVRPAEGVLRRGSLATAVLDAVPDAAAIMDRSGTIVAVNLAWRMFAVDNGGRAETTGPGVNYLDVCARAAASGCSDAATVLDGLHAVLDGATVESNFDYSCPAPTARRWFTSRITPIGAPLGGVLVTHTNITRRKMAEQALARQASNDPLTGLANGVLFNDALAAALSEHPGRSQAPDVGLISINLDGFKPVNDLYGHDAGDEVLLHAADRLRRAARPQDAVARLGGDEFAVCAPQITADGLAGLAGRIGIALAQPHRIHGQRRHVPGSIGTHLAPPGASVASTLSVAYQAMCAVKNQRRRPPAWR